MFEFPFLCPNSEGLADVRIAKLKRHSPGSSVVPDIGKGRCVGGEQPTALC
jgi:hypothetical protein